ncbi:MAG: PDZ domain-containing protein [SAR202 cluster bacterium]|nr:PDZ domain-containing protein [SAR202 cluster bacterium]|tara:strand:+ start:1668 stop:3302 length:1635 start_codon:yes stop_codon:yes gene_type:complete
MSLRNIIFLPATVNKGRLSNWIIICGLIFLLLSCTPSQQIKPPTVVTTNLDKHSPTVTQPVSTPEAADKTKNENHQSANSPSSVNVIKSIEQSFSSIYEDTKQSVVNIQIATRTQAQFEARGSGSGFVWDKLGHIVTNNHVIKDADIITITFFDGTSTTGTVIGSDPDSDLAVLKINVIQDEILKPLTIANSNEVFVGQLTIALGNPFGFQGTMTTGIVSAVGRLLSADLTEDRGYSIPDVIQTDAAINPGNSGGVLLNSDAQLIGVPTAIISRSQSSSGVGFAIPSNVVAKVIPQLIIKGEYEHPWLGVTIRSLTTGIATAMQLNPDQRGILVSQVQRGSPADLAGLLGSTKTVEVDGRPQNIGGDVIFGINGETTRDTSDLISYLFQSAAVGQTIVLNVLRDETIISLDVTLAGRPQRSSNVTNDVIDDTAWIGISGLTLTPKVAEANSLGEDQTGILIVNVFGSSPAEKGGLLGSTRSETVSGQIIPTGGDVITRLENKPVTNMESLQEALAKYRPSDKVQIAIIRNGKEITMDLILERRP